MHMNVDSSLFIYLFLYCTFPIDIIVDVEIYSNYGLCIMHDLETPGNHYLVTFVCGNFCQ